MRIWHEKLIPVLCRQHLLAVWREGLGCLKIVMEGKQGYRNHPATQEFIDAPFALYQRLCAIREEMVRRGYHPKNIPVYTYPLRNNVIEWEDLDTQIEKIKSKGCGCRLDLLSQ